MGRSHYEYDDSDDYLDVYDGFNNYDEPNAYEINVDNEYSYGESADEMDFEDEYQADDEETRREEELEELRGQYENEYFEYLESTYGPPDLEPTRYRYPACEDANAYLAIGNLYALYAAEVVQTPRLDILLGRTLNSTLNADQQEDLRSSSIGGSPVSASVPTIRRDDDANSSQLHYFGENNNLCLDRLGTNDRGQKLWLAIYDEVIIGLALECENGWTTELLDGRSQLPTLSTMEQCAAFLLLEFVKRETGSTASFVQDLVECISPLDAVDLINAKLTRLARAITDCQGLNAQLEFHLTKDLNWNDYDPPF